MQDILNKVKEKLGDGVNIDHVVSSLGYSSTITSTGNTEPLDVSLLRSAFEESFFPTMWAVDVFAPTLIPGSTFNWYRQDFGPNFWGTPVDAAADALFDVYAGTTFPQVRWNGLRRTLRYA